MPVIDTISRQLLRRTQRLERSQERLRPRIGRELYAQSGARLQGALIGDTRWGGGRLLYAMDCRSRQNYGTGYNTAWSDINMDASNYYAVTPTEALEYRGGGPYVTMNGTDEGLSIADASWQEAGAEELLVWGWVHPTSIAADMTMAAKWDTTGDQRSWQVWWSQASAVFTFQTNVSGLVGANVTLASTYATVAIDEWYFVAAYFEPSTRMQLYVAHNEDEEVTVDELAVGVPASLFNAGTGLTLGTTGTPDQHWAGKVGVQAGWLNVPSANLDTYVALLFHETAWAYPS